jgi:3-deoxy-manno-octulosonate cytidylyltransferase (CMP-KDO synthetase)
MVDATKPPPFGVVIPARLASSRLPGKVLRLLHGKSLIERVYGNARDSGADFVWVATDDTAVAAHVAAFGGIAIMTSAEHPNGTARIAEVVRERRLRADAIIVNLQGDEPLVPGALLREVAVALKQRERADIATAATPITQQSDLFDPNVVKVVLDQQGCARYFSRAPIPWVRGRFQYPAADTALPEGVPFLRHIGIYAYRARTLEHLARTPACPLEEAEALEQLRALWLGQIIHVSVIKEAPGHGVDTEHDLERVERLLAERAGA